MPSNEGRGMKIMEGYTTAPHLMPSIEGRAITLQVKMTLCSPEKDIAISHQQFADAECSLARVEQ